MADDGNDIERLLAEVEKSVGGNPARQPTPASRRERSFAAGLRARVSTAAAAGLVAAAAVFVLFALLPFLGATSGAAGAFLAAFISVFLLARR